MFYFTCDRSLTADVLIVAEAGEWVFCVVRMSDVMSTSVESLMIDVSNLDDEPSLVSSEQEPEAWSVTVDLKTLKKMTAKNIKRQDHIWGQSVTVLT